MKKIRTILLLCTALVAFCGSVSYAGGHAPPYADESKISLKESLVINPAMFVMASLIVNAKEQLQATVVVNDAGATAGLNEYKQSAIPAYNEKINYLPLIEPANYRRVSGASDLFLTCLSSTKTEKSYAMTGYSMADWRASIKYSNR